MTLTPQDDAKRLNTPPLQGRGRGWGLTAGRIAQLQERAAEMRRNPTEPEKRLWRRLSNGQLGGYKFRRQAVIGQHIADFACPQKALIVEVDGDTHVDPTADARRDDALQGGGFRVVRVTNMEVMQNMEGVLQQILAELQSSPLPFRGGAGGGASPQPTPPVATPHPNPSPEGEGLRRSRRRNCWGSAWRGALDKCPAQRNTVTPAKAGVHPGSPHVDGLEGCQPALA